MYFQSARPRCDGRERQQLTLSPRALGPELNPCENPPVANFKQSKAHKSLVDLRSSTLRNLLDASKVESPIEPFPPGHTPKNGLPRLSKPSSIDISPLAGVRSRAELANTGSSSPKKKTPLPLHEASSFKAKPSTPNTAETDPSFATQYHTISVAKTPVLHTEIKANGYKQCQEAGDSDKTLACTQTKQFGKAKNGASVGKNAFIIPDLEDLVYKPSKRKAKVNFLDGPCHSSTNHPNEDKSLKQTTSLSDCLKSTQKLLALGVSNTITNSVEKPVAKCPTLLPSDEGLITTTTDEINKDAVEDVISPISEAAIDAGTTTSSAEIAIERTQSLRLPAGKQTLVQIVEAVKLEHNTKPRIAVSLLRGDAQEFIPGQAYSPSIGSPEGSFSESPLKPPYNARMNVRSTTHPAALQMAGARPQRPVPSPSVTHPLPHLHPFHGIAGPYKYSPQKSSPVISSNGDQPTSRESTLPRCDVLELDPNTLQPVNYPGHTPLEWREMAQAIRDLNRKVITNPIPFGIEARARFHQPGKYTSWRGGDMASESDELSICSNRSSNCGHCGSTSHALERCPHPPLFSSGIRQHLTLNRYLHTAHWKRKSSQAYIESRVLLRAGPFDMPDPATPLACVIASEPHSEAEVTRAVDCIVEYLRAEGKSLDFDWRGYWMADFSQCPFMWALRPVDDRGLMYLVFNPTGSMVMRELIVTAEEALKGMGQKLEAEKVSSGE